MKTCFVVCPISDKGSEIREEANNLLWVVDQALRKHDFHVVRIDEIASSHHITQEIVRHIKEAELCVIVLTGDNPNVFYEAGRRHETGRPYIHLIRDGEQLPFDVKDINSIYYSDLSEVESVKALVAELENFVVTMREDIESAPHTRQVTLEGVFQVLRRIDDGVARLTGHTTTSPRTADPRTAMRNPREAFMLAFAQGDVDAAVALLPRLENLLGRSDEYHTAVVACAGAGSAAAAESAKGFLASPPDWFTVESILETVSGLANFYLLTDRESEGLEYLAPVIERALEEATESVRARLLNQKQRLLYGNGDYQAALDLAVQIIEIAPEEPSYYHNASMLYEQLGRPHEAASMADRALELDESDDSDHLSQATDVYLAVNEIDKFKDAFERLQRVDPAKASLKLMDSAVRRALGLN